MAGPCECTSILNVLRRTEWAGQILRRPSALQRQAKANLAIIDANCLGVWMGVPRELVDMIFRYLRTDWGALVSCSLTCRAFLRSARRVIHERLHVTGPRILPSIIKLTKWCWIYNQKYFRVLYLADAANLAQYTRHLIIEGGQILTPRSLRPYLPNFHKYVWLTSLTLTRFDPTPFLPVFDRHFHHLSQSLRSLTLILPRGIPDATVDFVSRFRNLDDLEFDPVPKPPRRPQRHQSSLIPPHRFTSLAGTLRILNTDSRRASSLEALLRFPGGLHFRSLQFACSEGIDTTGIVGKCSSTLESVMYKFHCREFASSCRHCRSSIQAHVVLESTLLEFNFKTCSNLRIFETRIDNPSYTLDDLLFWLVKILSTIRSPVFSKFILSLNKAILEPHVHLLEPAKTDLLDRWVSSLSSRSGMRFIIKGDLPLHWRQLLVFCLPSSANASAIRFDFPDPNAAPQCGRTK